MFSTYFSYFSVVDNSIKCGKYPFHVFHFWQHMLGGRGYFILLPILIAQVGDCFLLLPPILVTHVGECFFLLPMVWFDFMPINVTFVCQFLPMNSEND